MLWPRWWKLAVTLFAIWVISSSRLSDFENFKIYVSVLVVVAFFVAGEGQTLLFWCVGTLFALAGLSVLMIHPFAIYAGWLVCFGGIVAICTGTGVRYLFDVVRPLHRCRVILWPTEFCDRMTRLLLEHQLGWMFGFGFWFESLVLNTLSAFCLSFGACVVAAYFLEGTDVSMQLNALLAGYRPDWLIPLALVLALFLWFFVLFMWRSFCQGDGEEEGTDGLVD